jgi:hypothetical protein
MHTPAGWYPNPNGTQTKRWWDGAAWAPETQAYVAGPDVGHLEKPRTRSFVKWWAFAALLVAAVGSCLIFLGRDRSVRDAAPNRAADVYAAVVAQVGLVDPSINVDSVTCVAASDSQEVCTVLIVRANSPWIVDVSIAAGKIQATPRDQLVTELALLHNMKLQCDFDYDVIVLAPGVKFQCGVVTYEVNASGEVVQIA